MRLKREEWPNLNGGTWLEKEIGHIFYQDPDGRLYGVGDGRFWRITAADAAFWIRVNSFEITYAEATRYNLWLNSPTGPEPRPRTKAGPPGQPPPALEGGRWLRNAEGLWFEKGRRLWTVEDGKFSLVTDAAAAWGIRTQASEIMESEAVRLALSAFDLQGIYEKWSVDLVCDRARPRWLKTENPDRLYYLNAKAKLLLLGPEGMALRIEWVTQAVAVLDKAREIEEEEASQLFPGYRSYTERVSRAEKTFSYSARWKTEKLTCWACDWKGTSEQANIEHNEYTKDLYCPRCTRMLAVVAPTSQASGLSAFDVPVSEDGPSEGELREMENADYDRTPAKIGKTGFKPMVTQPGKVQLWSQDKYDAALKYAAEAHAGQFVPGSELPYVVHLVMVADEILAALQVEPAADGDLAVQCALLHDVIEDTGKSYADIEAAFRRAVAEGVMALSKSPVLKSKAEKMADSLARIKAQPREIAMVKLADRIVNMQPPPAHWSAENRSSYQEEAGVILKELNGASAFLADRLRRKIEVYTSYIEA